MLHTQVKYFLKHKKQRKISVIFQERLKISKRGYLLSGKKLAHASAMQDSWSFPDP